MISISISLVGRDLSWRLHSTKIPSEFLKPYILPKMVDPGWQLRFVPGSGNYKQCGPTVEESSGGGHLSLDTTEITPEDHGVLSLNRVLRVTR